MPALTLYRLLFDWDLADYVRPEVGEPQTQDIGEEAVAYWRQANAPEEEPDWAVIIKGAFPDEEFAAPPARDSALMIVRMTIESQAATWALAFGPVARYWLVGEAIDHEAHIHASVAALRDPQTGSLERLTGIAAHEIGQYLQRIFREIPTGGAIANFEYDYDVQVLRAAKGRPARYGIGKTVVGGESLRISAIDSFESALVAIRAYEGLVRLERATHGNDLPGPRPVGQGSVPALLDALATSLLAGDDTSDIAIVLPDDLAEQRVVIGPIGTSEVANEHRRNGIEQPSLADVIELLRGCDEIDRFTGGYLKAAKFRGVDEQSRASVMLFKTLAGRFMFDNASYLVDEGQVYRVPSGWLEALDARVNSCHRIIDYLAYNRDRHVDEATYNVALARTLRPAVVLDQQLVRGDAFSSGIEVADIAHVYSHGGVERVDLIHVKRGTVASKLSHLFTQVRTAVRALPVPSVRESLYQRICEQTRNAQVRARFRRALSVGSTYMPGRIRMIIGITAAWKDERPASTHLSVYGRQGLQQTIQDVARGGHEVALATIVEA